MRQYLPRKEFPLMKLDREKVKQNEQKDGKSSVKTMTEKEK